MQMKWIQNSDSVSYTWTGRPRLYNSVNAEAQTVRREEFYWRNLLFFRRCSTIVNHARRACGRFIPFTYFLIYSATVRQRQTDSCRETAPLTGGAARFLYKGLCKTYLHCMMDKKRNPFNGSYDEEQKSCCNNYQVLQNLFLWRLMQQFEMFAVKSAFITQEKLQFPKWPPQKSEGY